MSRIVVCLSPGERVPPEKSAGTRFVAGSGVSLERLDQRLAEQEVDQARQRFRAGVAGNSDVVNAALTLNAARSQYVDVLTSLQVARVSLARAEGAVTQLR